MFEIKCDKCGEDLIIDSKSTMDAYSKDMDYLVDVDNGLDELSIQGYMIYTCPLCKEKYKFTYKEWEQRYRKFLAQQVMEAKKQKMFAEEINPQSIDPDNGLEYCGQCSGYVGDGHCFVDIIKQCTIRKSD